MIYLKHLLPGAQKFHDYVDDAAQWQNLSFLELEVSLFIHVKKVCQLLKYFLNRSINTLSSRFQVESTFFNRL